MKYPLHGHRTVEVATTYNQKYYDIIGKRMVESFVRHWPKHIQLHVYWQEAEPEIIEDNIVYHELYQVQPQLRQWVDQHTDRKYHGWREDRGKFVWKNDGVEIIANDQGNRTTPSYVAFTDTERLIGDAAKNQVARNPENTVHRSRMIQKTSFSGEGLDLLKK